MSRSRVEFESAEAFCRAPNGPNGPRDLPCGCCIIWASGNCTDRPVVVVAGLYDDEHGMVKVKTCEHACDATARLPEELKRWANEYNTNVMGTLTVTEEAHADLGYVWDPDHDLDHFYSTADVWCPKSNDFLRVVKTVRDEDGEIKVELQPRAWCVRNREWVKRRASTMQAQDLCRVPVKHEERRDRVVGQEAVIVYPPTQKGRADLVGRVVNVARDGGDGKWEVSSGSLGCQDFNSTGWPTTTVPSRATIDT